MCQKQTSFLAVCQMRSRGGGGGGKPQREATPWYETHTNQSQDLYSCLEVRGLSGLSSCGLSSHQINYLGLLGAVCCCVSAAPVCIGRFFPLPAAWGLVRVFCDRRELNRQKMSRDVFCVLRLSLITTECFRSVLLVRAHGPALRLGVFLFALPPLACGVARIPAIASLCTNDRQTVSTKGQPSRFFEPHRIRSRASAYASDLLGSAVGNMPAQLKSTSSQWYGG